MALTDKLTAIANAIRAKTGKSASMTLAEMPSEIASIQTGITPSGNINITANGAYDVTQYASAAINVPVPSDTTATSAQILSEKTAYVGGVKVTGTMKCKMFVWDVTADFTDSKMHTIIANDPELKAQRNNENLFVAYNRIGGASSVSGIVCGVQRNSVMSSSETSSGAYVRNSSSGVSHQRYWDAGLKNSGTDASDLYIDANGTLQMFAHSTYGIRAGTYIFMVSWYE